MSSDEATASDSRVLVGRSFEVAALDGSPVLDGRRPQLMFGEDGMISGQATINRVFGPFELAEGIVRIGPMGSTMMAGPPDAMLQERRLLELLGGPLSIVPGAVTGEVLLTGDTGVAVLREAEGDRP